MYSFEFLPQKSLAAVVVT